MITSQQILHYVTIQNRHHLAITLYENTRYTIRIQLDCFPHAKGGLPDTNCNVAQDVNVLIDFNNDGRFDPSESRVLNRWPLLSTMPLGIYDLDIVDTCYRSTDYNKWYTSHAHCCDAK